MKIYPSRPKVNGLKKKSFNSNIYSTWIKIIAVLLSLLPVYSSAWSQTCTSTVWLEDFSGLSNGTTSDNGTTNWTSSYTGSSGHWNVQSNQFEGAYISPAAVWRSQVINIASFSSVTISMDVTGAGTLNVNEDYFRAYYIINGGSETPFISYNQNGAFGPATNTSPALSGSTLQIVVRAYSTYSDEIYRFDNVKVTGTSTLTANASVNGTLTCTNTSVTLSGSSNTSGVTYNWSGPNNFTSSTQNPTVSASGTYTLTVTNPSTGCTSTATVNVIQNIAAPDLSAFGGTISCSGSAVLSASSGVSGVTYYWTGPNNFTSTLQNPSVSEAGSYTVIATNPANGCTNSQTVSVNPVSASTFWLEDFTLSNGTTSDAGTTSWTSSTSGSGTFSVQNNEFKASFNSGNTAEGVWTSGVIDISSKSDVVASVDMRSETASTNDYFETNDYINVYYKLNGGAETLFFGDVAGLGSTTNVTATATATSPALNGSTLQIVIRLKNSDPTERYYFDNVKLAGIIPITATASVNQSLTCSVTSVTLSGASNTPGVVYSWTGPNGYVSTSQNPAVSAPGSYVLTVTNPTTGCTGTTSVNVEQNIIAPGATATGGTITCSKTSVTLAGSSSTSGVIYSWTGPNGFTSTVQNPSVSATGIYNLTVTNSVNGCTSSDTAKVVQNTTTPAVSATGASLPCSGSVSITGSSNVAGTIFNWTGPSGFTSTAQNPTVTATGVYTLTATDPANGCSAADTAIVVQGTTVPGVTAIAGDTLTCTTHSVTLYGNAGVSGVTYSWSGPGNFTSSLQNPAVSTPGTYTLTVTNPANGCAATVAASVVSDTSAPGATATGGTITCSNASVTLSGSSSTSGVGYSWSGPNSFTSAAQNPIVSTTGTYTLTVTKIANGCTSTATANVILNTTAPGASATGDTITCSKASVTLTGSSSTSGVTYKWSGPNSFSSTAQNPTVSTDGTYTLTVTNPVNGCTSTATANVALNAPTPGATAGGGGTVTCNTLSVTLTGSSSTPNVTYSWSGPNSFASASQNPAVTAGGTYTLTVTNPANGCISTATVAVTQNTTAPGATAAGGAITCTEHSVTLSGNSPTAGITYSWSGPGSFVSILQNPTVNTAGSYILTVKDPANGCTSTATASVILNTTEPGATATGGSITCFTPTATLSGGSGTSGVTYKWSGPDSFTSALQSPTVNQLGVYTLTVTNPANGCTSTATASVTQNTTAPEVTATVSGPITCANTSVALSVNSGISGLTYSWTGPDGFTSSLQNPSVSSPGIYTLAVTNPDNNCSSTKIVNVLQDKTKPGVKAYSNGTLTCGTTSVALTASSATPNTTFTWGGFSSGQNPVNTGYSGKYFVTAKNPSNGCTSIDSVVVSQVVSYTPYQFVYNNFSSYANGTISDAGTNGWDLDRTQVPSVTSTYGSNITPHYFAIYSHRVTAQQLGGQGIWYSKAMNVAGRPDFQIGIKITAEGTLNSDEYVKLYYKIDGGSEIFWDQRTGNFGTIDFRSPVLNANTVQIIVKLYNYSKGGSIVSNYYVEEEQLYIGGCGGSLVVYPSVSGTITCANPSATLSATSSHSGAIYQWSGPNGFSSTLQRPVVTTAGTYSVTATIPPSSVANGSVSVTENKVCPPATASVSDTLTCSRTYVTLSGYSTVTGVTYNWTGPNGFVSSMQNPIVTAPGTYTLTVTDPANGCNSVASVNVIQNTTISGATASVEDTLTCARTSVIITGGFTTSGVTFSWTGPGGFTSALQSPSVSMSGLYTLVVTDPGTGCTSTALANVVQNTTAPGATATGGTITCNTSSVELSGNSPTSGVTYSWTGPGNFTSSLKNPIVSLEGTYTLTVTNPVNGCTSTASATVTKDNTPPEVTITGGNITCAHPTVTLAGSSSAAGVTYSWTGPEGFTSNLQDINISSPGKYVLEVKNTIDGCSNKDSVTVLQNTTAPGATAGGGEITCANISVMLTGSSGTPGVTYSWSGPGNYTSAEQNPLVSISGTYILTVTDPVNGCTSTDTAIVSQDTEAPGAIASGGTITCDLPTVTLSGSSPTPGVTYRWTLSGGIITTEQNPTVILPGTYTLTVTNPATGCSSVDTANVYQNTTVPGADAVGGQITCASPSVTLTGNSGTAGVTYSWSGPGSFTSMEQNPVVSDPGTYTLTVTNPVNGCISADTAIVTMNIATPGAIATGGTITCINASVTLTGNSGTPGVTYHWEGPGNFTSSLQNPSVTASGTYTLTVTNPVNGCSSTDTAMVSQNTSVPGAVATGGSITCTHASVILSGNSPTPGVTYSWIGPDGFTSTVQNPTVTTKGTYTLTVTNPANGCTSTDTAMVSEYFVVFNATASVDGNLTCMVTSVTLSGSSDAIEPWYSWSGPENFVSTSRYPVVNTPGKYILKVTDAESGCTSTDSVIVYQDLTPPVVTISTSNDTITCLKYNSTLTANSSDPGVDYNWTGPNGYTASDITSIIAVNQGVYTIRITTPAGCTASDSVNIIVNKDKPGAVADSSGQITCNMPTVTLFGSSPTPGVTFKWIGPTGFGTQYVQNPSTSISGGYILTVTNPVNGCTSQDIVTVLKNVTPPASVTAIKSSDLKCNISEVTLSGNSSTSGVTYSWSGPNGFSSALKNTIVTDSGKYILTVANPVNGCTAQATATVTKNTTPPDLSIATVSLLTCNNTSAELNASSATSGVTFTWAGFASGQNPVSVTSPDTYVVTATNPSNGCSTKDSVTVDQDIAQPDLSIDPVGVLTLINPTVNLNASSATPNTTISWEGFAAGQNPVTVSAPGTYHVTVTNNATGCTKTDSVTVIQELTPPDLTISPVNTLTCMVTSVNLSASSATPNTTITWTGFAVGQSTITVSTPGKYFVTAFNNTNGASTEDSVVVIRNVIKPDLSIAPANSLTCARTSVSLTASSVTPNTTFTWSGFPAGQNPVDVSAQGKYVVTAINNVNGCITKDSVTVGQDITPPGATAFVHDTITCSRAAVTLSAGSPTTGVTYKWAGPGDYISTEQYPVTFVPGSYTVTVTNPANGCTSVASANVQKDTIAPAGVMATVSDTLTCSRTTVTLSALSATQNVTFVWTGPNGYASSDQNAEITVPGLYALAVRNSTNGCLSYDSITVQQNTLAPQGVTASKSGDITCRDTIITLYGESTTPGVTYTWSGPGLSSSLPSPTTKTPGTYTLTVTDPVNNCFVVKMVSVNRDQVKPQGISTSVSGTLTCDLTSVSVSASSSTPGVTYHWTGPENFVSDLQAPDVSTYGSYLVTITNTANWCTENRTVTVSQNMAVPQGITAGVSGTLTCADPERYLSASSSTTGVTYSWTGPDGFSSAIASPVVTIPGDYTLEVKHPTSGCIETRVVPVLQDITIPDGVDASVSGPLNCSHLSVTIAAAPATGVTYNWTGPGNFTSTSQSQLITNAGTYKLTVTNTGNGCTASDSVVVAQDFTKPDVSTHGATITCANPVVNVSVYSETPGVTYLWSGEGLIDDPGTQNPSVVLPGDYSVKVTNPANGCFSTAVATVDLDNTEPELTISNGKLLTCFNPADTLTASSSTPGAILSWNNFPGQNPLIVTTPGTYSAIALNPANGCEKTKDIIISQNIDKPDISTGTNGTLLTCANTSISLTASSTSANTTITWTGYPAGITSIDVNSPGTYYATAQSTVNGCASKDSVVISQNIAIPDLTAQGASITCADPVVTVTASSSVLNAVYNWSGDGLIDDPGTQNPMVVLPGDYSVTVSDPANGCENSTTVLVDLDSSSPVCNIITQDSPTALADNTVTAQETMGTTYSWTISSTPGWSIVSGANTSELTFHAGDVGTSATFTLTVEKQNGCGPSTCQTTLTAVSSLKSAPVLPLAGTTMGTPVEDIQISVYPNPFSGKAYIEFTPAESSRVTIELYSANGNLLQKLFDNDVTGLQTYKVDVDGESMPAGTYYVIIRTDKKVYRHKLILVK